MQRLITDSRKNLSFIDYYATWVGFYLYGLTAPACTHFCNVIDQAHAKPPSPLPETQQGGRTVVRM